MSKKILIIGSGIAGISASIKLKSLKYNPVIVDKGNFSGGRLSTHNIRLNNNYFSFSHGAQYITAKYPNFQKIINACINNKCLVEYKNFSPKRYIGKPDLRHFIDFLLKETNVTQQRKVIAISVFNNQLLVKYEKCSKYEIYDGVISTIPAPQNISLLFNFKELNNTLSSASYDPCIALMLSIKKTKTELPTFFKLLNNEKKIFQSIGSANINDCWTLHANSSYSKRNFALEQNTIILEMVESFNKILQNRGNFSPINILYKKLHFWRYARVNSLATGKQIDPVYPIAIAGDFLEGPRVEAGFISGEKAAMLIHKRLSL